MLQFPDIDPVAFSFLGLDIYWYGVSYLLGFLAAYWVAIVRARRYNLGWSAGKVADLLFYFALGVIFGGRIGYLLFYDFALILDAPWQLLAFWERGRSFHGGLLGVLIAFYFFCKQEKKTFLQVTDFIAPVVPIGIGLGRLGNFVNGELWGKVTTVPWGMFFPHAGKLPRHPSQIYEFLLEGVVLFIVLFWFAAKFRNKGRVSGLFLVLYGVFRFGIEFFREPDHSMGYIFLNWVTMGQILSLPMVVIGCYLLWRKV